MSDADRKIEQAEKDAGRVIDKAVDAGKAAVDAAKSTVDAGVAVVKEKIEASPEAKRLAQQAQEEARKRKEKSEGIGAWASNNKGLLFAAVAGVLSFLGVEGFLGVLMMGAAVTFGFIMDKDNSSSLLGSVFGKKEPVVAAGQSVGHVVAPPARTVAAAPPVAPVVPSQPPVVTADNKKSAIPASDPINKLGEFIKGTERIQDGPPAPSAVAAASPAVPAAIKMHGTITETQLPVTRIPVDPANKIISFMVNTQGEETDRPVAGTLKVIAKNDGQVLNIAITGEDGKFANNQSGNIIVTSPVSKTTLPVVNGFIDLPSVREQLDTLRRDATPIKQADFNTAAIQGLDVKNLSPLPPQALSTVKADNPAQSR